MLQVIRYTSFNKIYKFQEVRIKVRDESETQKSSNITCVINVFTCFRTHLKIIAKKILKTYYNSKVNVFCSFYE